jgi:non-ribosomal peptide synthase protein (TIGR01720 family)
MFPVELELDADADCISVLHMVRQKLHVPAKGIGYGLMRYLAPKESQLLMQAQPSAEVSFNYLGQFADHIPAIGSQCGPGEFKGDEFCGSATRSHLIEMIASVHDRQLGCEFHYNTEIHTAASIELLSARYIACLRNLMEVINHGN